MKNRPFQYCLSCLILLLLEWCVYVVLFLYYSLYGEQRVLLKEVKDHELPKRQVTHIIPPIFLLYALVFSVLCMIRNFQSGL
jgi:hypothetical protein